jgi:hypothetical protein
MLRRWRQTTRLTRNLGVWDSASTAVLRDAWIPLADRLFTAVDFPTPTPASPSIRACPFCSAPVTSRKIYSGGTYRPASSRRNRFLDHGEDCRDLWICGGILNQTLRGPKHFIHIPSDPGPTQGANLIDDLGRVSATGSQVAAVDNQVGRGVPQIRKNCLERAPVAVNI